MYVCGGGGGGGGGTSSLVLTTPCARADSAFVIAKDTELTLDREIARNVIPLRELVKFSGAGPVWFNLYRDGQPAGAIELSIEFVAA